MGVRLLLDTHALVWWWREDGRLPPNALEEIASADNEVAVSAASAWEIANKYRIGKWPEVAGMVSGFDTLITESGFEALPVGTSHALLAGSLPGPHRDPVRSPARRASPGRGFYNRVSGWRVCRLWGARSLGGGTALKAVITVMLKPGVLDPQGRAIGHALHGLGFDGVGEVRAGKVIELELAETDATRARASAEAMARKLLANTVIESFRVDLA